MTGQEIRTVVRAAVRKEAEARAAGSTYDTAPDIADAWGKLQTYATEKGYTYKLIGQTITLDKAQANFTSQGPVLYAIKAASLYLDHVDKLNDPPAMAQAMYGTSA